MLRSHFEMSPGRRKSQCLLLRWLSWALLSTAVAAPALSVDFPPITNENRTLTEVPGDPTAVAVVLFKKGELEFAGYRHEDSRLTVHTRMKILEEEGKSHGEVEIPHNKYFKLTEFKGRTVSSDGTEVLLGEDDIFIERRSKAQKSFVTKATFPAVEVGAILDFTYVFRWGSLYQHEPWFFHNRLPTLYSEIVYLRPRNLSLRPWGRETQGKIQNAPAEVTVHGTRHRIYMENLGAIPAEPFSFPFTDLSSRIIMLPEVFWIFGIAVPITDDWTTVCEIFVDEYKKTRRRGGQAKKLAQELTEDLPSERDKAVRLYRFVRDEIRVLDDSIVPATESSNKILKDKKATSAGKVLLLQTLLEGVDIDSQPVWARHRSSGRVDLAVPSLLWFDTTFLRLELDGETFYLDPSDERLAFGLLGPGYEGTAALVHDRKEPEIVTLPESSFTSNQRHAKVDFTLEPDGRMTGTGELVLTGQHARRNLTLDDDLDAAAEEWQEWLEGAYEGFEIGGLSVIERLEEARLEVAWTLEQKVESVLGDEATLWPSRPVGPDDQPFTLAHEKRLTPVSFSFTDREEVEVSVSWPEDWTLDVIPEGASFENEFGALEVRVELEEENRRLSYTRRFDLKEREIPWRRYPEIQDLYDRLEKSDAQDVVFFLE